MGSSENTNWLLDCDLIDEINVNVGEFSQSAPGLYLSTQGLNGSSNSSVNIGASSKDNNPVNSISKKRLKNESCNRPTSKAFKEKMRRDKLNEKFIELGSIMDPTKPVKLDKVAILNDAIHMVTSLFGEEHKLKESNLDLQNKIKELKAEKIELREEKQKLKAEKEQLEQQLKTINSFPPSFPAAPPPYSAENQHSGSKLVPVVAYSGIPMWQLLPPTTLDTSQDHILHPPVA